MNRRDFALFSSAATFSGSNLSDALGSENFHLSEYLEILDVDKTEQGIKKCIELSIKRNTGVVFVPDGTYTIRQPIDTKSIAIIGISPSHPSATTKSVIFKVSPDSNYAGPALMNVKHVENIYFNYSDGNSDFDHAVSIRPFKSFVIGCNFVGFPIAIKRSDEGNGGCAFMRIINNGFFNCRNSLVFDTKGGKYHNLIVDDNYFISGSQVNDTGYTFNQGNKGAATASLDVAQIILPGKWLGGSLSRNLFEQLALSMSFGSIQDVLFSANYFEAVDVDMMMRQKKNSNFVSLANYHQNNNCFVTELKKNTI